MRRALLALIAVTACRTPAPAPAHPALSNRDIPAVARPASSSLAIASRGRWHGVDDDKWTYELVIPGDGTFRQIVHPTGDPACEQTGPLTIGKDELMRTFTSNACNHEYDRKTVHDHVESIDSAHMALRMESGYVIRYDRAP